MPNSALYRGDALTVAFYAGFAVFTVWRDSESRHMLHILAAAIVCNLVAVERWTASLIVALALALLLGQGMAYLMTELSRAIGLDESEALTTEHPSWRKLIALRCLGVVFVCAVCWTVRGAAELFLADGSFDAARQHLFAAGCGFALVLYPLYASGARPAVVEFVRLRRLALICAPLLYCLIAESTAVRDQCATKVVSAILLLSPFAPCIVFANSRSARRKSVAHWLLAFALPAATVWCTSFLAQSRMESYAQELHRQHPQGVLHTPYQETLIILACSSLWVLILYTLYAALMVLN